MRTRRVEPDGTVYEYVYNGSLLTQMTVDGNTLFFSYDAAGLPVSVTLNGTTYYYVTNLQGDVVGIVDSIGHAVARYEYNAWGKIESELYIEYRYIYTNASGDVFVYALDYSDDAIGRLNPLRYRGYVYDEHYCIDTGDGNYESFGLYYLQSRYYNPEWGRFITADNIDYLGADGTITSYNAFAYCSNNPVMYSDPSGQFAISLTMLGLFVGAAIGAIACGAVAYNIAKDSGAEGWELVGWTTLGVLGGGIIGSGLGAAGGAIATKVTGIVGLSITKYSIIPIRNITLLGNMPAYMDIAREIGAGFYHIPDKLYNSLSVAERLNNNMQYIKDAAALGSQFVLSPDWVTKEGSTLWYEIQCLIEKLISWIMY